jgi:hypothetical protein
MAMGAHHWLSAHARLLWARRKASVMADIETQSFNSTNISGAEYNPDTGDLSVTFARTGTTYDYINVPPTVWAAMKEASSVGQYFRENIAGIYGS